MPVSKYHFVRGAGYLKPCIWKHYRWFKQHFIRYLSANNISRDPNIRHEWLSIPAQYSAKIKMRDLPLLLNRYRKNNVAPVHIALGFAAYIRFMKITKDDSGNFICEINGRNYKVTDDQAALLKQLWQNNDTGLVIENVSKNEQIWRTDLSVLPGFQAAVAGKLKWINAGKTLVLTFLYKCYETKNNQNSPCR